MQLTDYHAKYFAHELTKAPPKPGQMELDLLNEKQQL